MHNTKKTPAELVAEARSALQGTTDGEWHLDAFGRVYVGGPGNARTIIAPSNIATDEDLISIPVLHNLVPEMCRVIEEQAAEITRLKRATKPIKGGA